MNYVTTQEQILQEIIKSKAPAVLDYNRRQPSRQRSSCKRVFEAAICFLPFADIDRTNRSIDPISGDTRKIQIRTAPKALIAV